LKPDRPDRFDRARFDDGGKRPPVRDAQRRNGRRLDACWGASSFDYGGRSAIRNAPPQQPGIVAETDWTPLLRHPLPAIRAQISRAAAAILAAVFGTDNVRIRLVISDLPECGDPIPLQRRREAGMSAYGGIRKPTIATVSSSAQIGSTSLNHTAPQIR
jgi:hypothetical protein